MLKLQKQSNRTQSAQSSSVNNEIFRKVNIRKALRACNSHHYIPPQKLQHAKAESDREIATLKRRIQELESQSQRQGAQTSTLTTKRRRII